MKDAIATPVLRATLGRGVDESVTARFTPAPVLGAGVEVSLRPGTHIVMTGSWSGAKLRATDGGGERDVQNVSIIEGLFGIRHMFGTTLEAGGGFGGIHFSSEDRALFRGGAATAPVVEAGVGAGRNLGAHRLHVRAVGQMHRFSTEAMRNAGGKSGNVARYGIQAAFTWNGAVIL